MTVIRVYLKKGPYTFRNVFTLSTPRQNFVSITAFSCAEKSTKVLSRALEPDQEVTVSDGK